MFFFVGFPSISSFWSQTKSLNSSIPPVFGQNQPLIRAIWQHHQPDDTSLRVIRWLSPRHWARGSPPLGHGVEQRAGAGARWASLRGASRASPTDWFWKAFSKTKAGRKYGLLMTWDDVINYDYSIQDQWWKSCWKTQKVGEWRFHEIYHLACQIG